MKGYIAAKETSFEDDFREGQDGDGYFMFHLTIKIHDLDNFLTSPMHETQAIGYVRGNLIGGQCPVLKGLFKLFIDTADHNE